MRVKVKAVEWDDTTRTLHVTRVTPEGKKEMNYQDFLRGQQPRATSSD